MPQGPAAHATPARNHTSVTSTIRTCGAASAPVLAGRPKCAALRDCPPVPFRSAPFGSATTRTVPSLASTRSPCQRPSRHGPPGRPAGRSRTASASPGGVPGGGKARRRHARQRCRADLPAQPGQQPQERPDLQEAVRVRQRRRRRQVIARVGLPVPLRQPPQRRRGGPRLHRPRQGNLHRQPRRDLPQPPGRHPGQRLVQQRRGDHRRRQPQPRPIPRRPRDLRDPRGGQLLRGPRRLRGGRARQRAAHHDPRTRAGKLGQPPAGVPPDGRHRHHLGQARLRVPHRPLPAAQLPPRNPRPVSRARRRDGTAGSR